MSLPLPTSAPSTQPMSTSHSGLPSPAAMAMPQLTQGPLPMDQPLLSQPIGQLPAPPQKWQGAEESMRSWLHAKAEEYKQKQEEEKTRQEMLRLEQRRIEQDMLWTALTGGIPPNIVPRVFVGIGDSNFPNSSLELPQHSMAKEHHLAQQQLQQQQLLSVQAQPSLNQQSQHYDSQQHPIPVPPPLTSRAVQSSGAQASYQTSPASPSGQCHQPQDSPVMSPPSHLPGPNIGELHIRPPPAGHSGMHILPSQPSHALHRSENAQQPQQPQQELLSLSPSISFYHRQPPTTSQAGTSSASELTTSADHSSFPKKRKAQGSQQAALHRPPNTHPHYSPNPNPLSRTRNQADIASSPANEATPHRP